MSRFGWKVGVALALVILGDIIFYQNGLYGGHFGIYAVALIAGMALARTAVLRDGRAAAAMVLALVFAGALVFDASLLAWSMFWTAVVIATLLPATASFGDGWRWFQRLFMHALRSTVGPLIDLNRLMKTRRKWPARRFGVRASAPHLVLPLVGGAIITALFAAANPLVDQLISSIRLPDVTFLSIARMLLWFALFLGIWSLLRPRIAKRVIPTFDGSGDLAIPGVTVKSVTLSLALFNLLFAGQNILDTLYLWGLAPLPDGMGLAEYAHRGAYPLIATALLAGLFVLVTLRPGSTTAAVPAIRTLLVIWIGQNVFLVASSILRTIDYVDAYSLTRLRIAALAWMVLVAVGLVLICWRMLREKSAAWLINSNLIAAGTVLSACCFVDLGAVAARWNVAHAYEVDRTGAALDLCYLEYLDSSALPALITLEKSLAAGPFRDRVSGTRVRVQSGLQREIAQGGWTLLGQSRLDDAIGQMGVATAKPAVPYCDGYRAEPAPTLTEGAQR